MDSSTGAWHGASAIGSGPAVNNPLHRSSGSSMSDRPSHLAVWDHTPAFARHEPGRLTVPLVFNSPHSGRFYPPEFIASSRLTPDRLRKSEDAFVEELFAGVTGYGAPMLAARFPRAYLDLNREPYELDPDLFEDTLPAFANTRSLRVLGGLGTIARVVGEAEEIYNRRLSVDEGMARIDRLYWPYHAELRLLLDRAEAHFGCAVLIDCHSMPSSVSGSGSANEGTRAHFVLGDRFGASCASELTRYVEQTLSGFGYNVALNRPYAGGYITEHYGNPVRGVHALQLEVNRALFTDEAALTVTDGFGAVRRHMMQLVSGLAGFCETLQPLRAAAE